MATDSPDSLPRGLVECSMELSHFDARHSSLVKLLSEGIIRGEFTVTELLGAIPEASLRAEGYQMMQERSAVCRYPVRGGG